ncbi:MAG: GlxA family transcriptional regulator [Woeseia sp.]
MTNFAEPRPVEVGILIVAGFTALHLDLAVDGFRIANRVEGRTLFRWSVLAPDARAVEASNGRAYAPDAVIDMKSRFDVAFVIAGYQPDAAINDTCLAWLRTQNPFAKVMAAVDTGTVLLAHAGLGRGRKLAIHWEHEPVLAAAFPRLELSSAGAMVDGRYFTSSGGLSAATTVLAIIRHFCKAATAGRVAEILYQAGRVVQGTNDGPRGDPIERVERLMRQNLQVPLSLDELAGAVHMHKRTLARAFAKARGVTPMGRYRELRLQQARELLASNRTTISDAADQTGFSSVSGFSTAFRRRFGSPPSRTG